INALHTLETRGEVEPMSTLFDDDAQLSNVTHPAPFHGKAGVYRFWRDYCFLFQEIHTEFHRIVESEDSAVLEWTSKGILSSGKPFEYQGVTWLEFNE